MSIFNKIIEFFFGKPKIVEHTFFGEMTDIDTYFECRRIFEPTNKMVEIGLEKKDPHEDDKQVMFFHWIEENYGLIIEKITPKLEERIAKRIPGYQIENFKVEFELEYIWIPNCEVKIPEWQISFYANNELQHSCSIEMKGLEAKNIMIDG